MRVAVFGLWHLGCVTAACHADAGHDVPISIVARDQKVLDRIAGWGWTPGLEPDPAAPVWPMRLGRYWSAISPLRAIRIRPPIRCEHWRGTRASTSARL